MVLKTCSLKAEHWLAIITNKRLAVACLRYLAMASMSNIQQHCTHASSFTANNHAVLYSRVLRKGSSVERTYLFKHCAVKQLTVHRIFLNLPVACVHNVAVLTPKNEATAIRYGMCHPDSFNPAKLHITSVLAVNVPDCNASVPKSRMLHP